MGRAFEVITEPMRALIERQHLFFVATAPLGGGHVNLSPKGYDSFRILDDRRVAYLDLTGSGAETIAHVRENGRITFMFCAFDGAPNIVRLYGQGRVVREGDDDFADLRARFDDRSGVRAVIVADLDRTSSSCGYAVPRFAYEGDRERLEAWAGAKSADELEAYRAGRNATSIDGLPALG